MDLSWAKKPDTKVDSPVTRRSEPVVRSASGGKRQTGAGRFVAPLIVLIVSALVYGAVYCREDSIPTAIGANLVPAERILKGEVPYRDFYKIQTPGILLLNAALFKIWGTTLLTAMTAVMVFKALTVAMIFLIGRKTLSLKAALVSAMLALVWLAPGGPFRPAPIQYEMLFTALAIYFVLRWIESSKWTGVFVAGLSVGIVAIFKQNVGVYTAVALLLAILVDGRSRSLTEAGSERRRETLRALVAASIGIAIPLSLLCIYLISNRALGPAIDVFVRAPGEHIQSRFTGYPVPKYALVVFIAGTAAVVVASRLALRSPNLERPLQWLLLAGAAICAVVVPQSVIDNSLYWFSPALFVCAAWLYFHERRVSDAATKSGSRVMATLLLFAVAAYGEVFPRSVRGLVIGTLPPAFLLLMFLSALRRDSQAAKPGDSVSFVRSAAVSATVVLLIVFALRIDLPEYFSIDKDRGLSFKAQTELTFDRGRGIYLPASRAEEVNATVEAIQAQVEPGGYFFAHALDASSYYFLSDRNSPTGATLWNDTGTNDRERVRTMDSLKEKNVRLVLTSEQAMNAERYTPLLNYLTNDFHQLKVIGRTIFLERNR